MAVEPLNLDQDPKVTFNHSLPDDLKPPVLTLRLEDPKVGSTLSRSDDLKPPTSVLTLSEKPTHSRSDDLKKPTSVLTLGLELDAQTKTLKKNESVNFELKSNLVY